MARSLKALNGSERRAYHATVAGSHSRRYEVVLLNLDGRVVRDITDDYLGGSLQGDTTQTPAETFEATVLDEDRRMDWSHGRHRNFQLRVVDYRFIPDIGANGAWVYDVGFSGPIWKISRDGDVVTVVAHSGERLAMGSVQPAFTRPRKARATGVIRDLLDAAGAKKRQRRIPARKARLPKAVTVAVDGKDKDKKKDDGRRLKANRTATYFGVADRIARGIGMELYWDRGVFRLANPQGRPSASFGNPVLTAPVSETPGSDGEVVNTWIVLGHKRPKGKKRPTARSALPGGHPSSARRMGWNGKRRPVIATVERNHARTGKACKKIAAQYRKRGMREQVAYQVSALPVRAWIRPNALVKAQTTNGWVRVRVRQWTIPYSAGADVLTIGANRRRTR